MSMEAGQEVSTGANANNKAVTQNTIIKGKRTKRPMPASPLTLAIATSSSSSSIASLSNSLEFADQDEEDMANCLILLAQGHLTPNKLSETPLPQTSKGLCIYQCKTCNRCFPSFQALGGHRASHKKPKLSNDHEDNIEKTAATLMDQEVEDRRRRHRHHQFLDYNMSTALSLQIVDKGIICSNFKSYNKVHECSICGAEFSSGQALGGHMRRHRAVATTSSTTPTPTTTTTTRTLSSRTSSPESLSQESKKSGNGLQLDLNLPAPDEDADQHRFHLASSKEQFFVFSASSLVDCHY